MAAQPGFTRNFESKKDLGMAEKKFKQMCECTNCGNEAEMIVTCTLVEETAQSADPKIVPRSEGKTQGHAVCTHCGNEADIWLDI
jgi:hypothetical protein